jgi:hypothetical protein
MDGVVGTHHQRWGGDRGLVNDRVEKLICSHVPLSVNIEGHEVLVEVRQDVAKIVVISVEVK